MNGAVHPGYSMGTHTLRVPMELFALNRRRLCEALRTAEGVQDGAVVLLQGGEEVPIYCTDVNYEFKQVSVFSSGTQQKLSCMASLLAPIPSWTPAGTYRWLELGIVGAMEPPRLAG